MSRPPSLYQRLPGGRIASLGTRSSLWLAPDHLLALERTIGSERYRRFYLRDVEAIVIRRTARRAVLNVVCLLLAAVTMLPALQFGRESVPTLVTSGAVSAFWLLLALVNTLRGAACDTRIRTAVQIEPLPSLGRIPAVEKMFGRVRPRIEEAQGQVAPEQLLAADWTITQLPGAPAGGVLGDPHIAPARISRTVHGALFALLVVSGVVSFAEGLAPSVVSTALDLLLSFVALLLLMFALRRQSGGDLSRGVKRATWAVVGLFMAGISAGFVYGIIYAIRHQGQQPVDPLFFRSEPGFVYVQLAAGGLALLLGLLGLFLLWRERTVSQPNAAPPA